MAITKQFSTGGSGVSANYDYFDIAEGTAYNHYKGFCLKTSAATTYKLTTSSSIYSESLVDNQAPGQADYTDNTNIEFNFDVQFNLPKTIANAPCYINIPIKQLSPGSINTLYCKVRVLHYDGSTETVIGAETTTATNTADNTTTYHTFTIPITLTERHFKAGEILRLEIVTYPSGVAGGESYTMYFDPTGAALDTDDIRRLSFFVPFKIDVA